jgi:hypothetical protein
MQKSILFLLLFLFFSACQLNTLPLKNNFNQKTTPPAPNYSKPQYWASLPEIADASDSTPVKSNLKNAQAVARADVFFIYPTIFAGTPKIQSGWNADVTDDRLNQRIQATTILNQASVFNGACRIYVPYYRQADAYAFYTPNKADAAQALDLAYADVKAAVEYYLEHYNQGRPIVIASHSQGSYHAERLLRDFFDGKELQKKLVAAYLVGFPIKPDAFTHIRPSESPEEVGVWASWNTFGKDYYPDNYEQYFKGALSTNPLLWNSSEDFASQELNLGGVGLNFTFKPHLVDAQNHGGILWINKPYLTGRRHMHSRSWHRADMNFFYMNIRENVALRIGKFMESDPLLASSESKRKDLPGNK